MKEIHERMESAYAEIDEAIEGALAQMLRQGIDEGVVTFKLAIGLTGKDVVDTDAQRIEPGGELVMCQRVANVPEMSYEVRVSLTQKAKVKGFIDCGGDEVYIDKRQGLMMRKISSPQTSMFDGEEDDL